MIRTVEQYIESLRDGRVVYYLGEKVKDITTHPLLRKMVKIGAMDWVLTNDPNQRDLFVTKNEEGEEIHFLWKQPKSKEDLLRRRKIYLEGTQQGGVLLHCVGVDALSASRVLAEKMDKKLGTNYIERVESYRRYLQKTDIGVCGAITDVKGDRSLHASAQKQHKDFYVRVVEKRDDGIIVRGAKFHISLAAIANDALVLPCRAHAEKDKDYAVVFATPMNAKGIKIINSEPERRGRDTEENIWDYPESAHVGAGDTEALIIFDDVFVPWERVFMCGEWQYSQDVARLFGTFHRLFGSSRMVSTYETLTGAAALMAEYNGLMKYTHIRNKLSWLAQTTETFKALSLTSCMYPEKWPESDIVFPNLMFTNTAKYIFANSFHQAVKLAQDICGGIAADPISFKDWNNLEERPYLEKYFGAKAGVPTEHRLRAVRLLHDITSGRRGTMEIHAEGSLAAQQMMNFFAADWELYKASAKKRAGIPGWEKHKYFGKLPNYGDLVESKMPPVDESYDV